MKNFKSFTPKVDKSRRLVMTRFYAGVNGSNVFCYEVSRINKKGLKDKKFSTLFAFGEDDFSSIKDFSSSRTGEKVKVFKSPFKSVFGLKEKANPEVVWMYSDKKNK